MGVSVLKTQLSVINLTCFPRVQILIFLLEATQNDHIRLLYKFENDQKKFGCVGSCGYAPGLLNIIKREAGAYPQIPTQPIFFIIIFELIQQSNMVILSRLAKKN